MIYLQFGHSITLLSNIASYLAGKFKKDAAPVELDILKPTISQTEFDRIKEERSPEPSSSPRKWAKTNLKAFRVEPQSGVRRTKRERSPEPSSSPRKRAKTNLQAFRVAPVKKRDAPGVAAPGSHVPSPTPVMAASDLPSLS